MRTFGQIVTAEFLPVKRMVAAADGMPVWEHCMNLNIRYMIKSSFFAVLLSVFSFPAFAAEQVLVHLDDPAQLKVTTHLDSSSRVITDDGHTALSVTFGHDRPYPNVLFKPVGARTWDLSSFTQIEVQITNISDEAVKVGCRVDSNSATGGRNAITSGLTFEAGASETLVVPISRRFAMDLREQLKGMHYSPWGLRDAGIDPEAVVTIQLFVQHPTRSYSIVVKSVRATGTFDPKSMQVPEPFFPFIDQYGQYIHRDWPGKIKSDADFAVAARAEQQEMRAHPHPVSWDQFGGWADGPKLLSAGHFRTEKYEGKWYFVDPEGHLFWSLGMDVVQAENAGSTPITDDRLDWFADKPWESDPVMAKYKSTGKVQRGDYAKQKTVPVFSFYSANLQRKYGGNWYKTWLAGTPGRLMNWGFNTIGNWSDAELMSKPSIAYTAWVYINSAKLPWQQGTRSRISDPFDPMLEQELARRARNALKEAANDPWCIGIFVDNELSWGDTSYLARGVVEQGAPDQPAKQAMLKWLHEKYGTLEGLNAAWGTNLPDLEAFLQSRVLPSTEAGQADLVAFNEIIVRKYFQTIRDGLKAIAPNKLYLGCRFVAYDNDQVVRIAAEYADVISINLYRDTIGSWQPPAKVDRPFLVGEFHFGASDRGVFGPGLVPATSAGNRAEKFESYLDSALKNPLIVGAHWFQMLDEPTTGRTLDGENHNVGFITITDSPYPEMIAASRRIAEALYSLRAGN